MLVDVIKGKVDILLISGTKIDETFLPSQFHIPGFSSPYRLDRTKNGGGNLIYIRENVPSKNINIKKFRLDIECIFIEINLYKKKWLIGGTHNPCKTMTTNHLSVLSKYIDHHLTRYDNIVIMGEFNSESTQLEIQEPILHRFISNQ